MLVAWGPMGRTPSVPGLLDWGPIAPGTTDDRFLNLGMKLF